ncbi:hypothetical protein GSUB_07330 [Geoalkalibacter subterraneus]|uniref:Uncharacterized protein n=1 Tax=Geoalkalibacter subterraneus TaxID=483547 RepID=A0A0B5FQM2_9BACT|nr:hypothetical protein GSUB_07330 [Geoalkalibacter subterraneus]
MTSGTAWHSIDKFVFAAPRDMKNFVTLAAVEAMPAAAGFQIGKLARMATPALGRRHGSGGDVHDRFPSCENCREEQKAQNQEGCRTFFPDTVRHHASSGEISNRKIR